MISLSFSIPHDLTSLKAKNASFTYAWYCEMDLTSNDGRKDVVEQLCSVSMLLSTGHLDPDLWGTRRSHLSMSIVRRAEELRP